MSERWLEFISVPPTSLAVIGSAVALTVTSKLSETLEPSSVLATAEALKVPA